MTKVHETKKCDICDLDFVKGNLAKHKRIHIVIKFECEKCGMLDKSPTDDSTQPRKRPVSASDGLECESFNIGGCSRTSLAVPVHVAPPISQGKQPLPLTLTWELDPTEEGHTRKASIGDKETTQGAVGPSLSQPVESWVPQEKDIPARSLQETKTPPLIPSHPHHQSHPNPNVKNSYRG